MGKTYIILNLQGEREIAFGPSPDLEQAKAYADEWHRYSVKHGRIGEHFRVVAQETVYDTADTSDPFRGGFANAHRIADDHADEVMAIEGAAIWAAFP